MGVQTKQTEEFDCLEWSINLVFLFLKEAQLSTLAAKHYEGNKYKTSISSNNYTNHHHYLFGLIRQIYYEGWNILFLPSEIQPWLLIHLTEKLPQQNWNTSLHSNGQHEAEKQETQTASTLAELK